MSHPVDQVIGHQIDSGVIQGVSTAATVHVNNLAMLEALLNVGATGFEIGTIGLGLMFFCFGLQTQRLAKKYGAHVPSIARRRQFVGALLMQTGLSAPFVINWLIASARDAALFN